MRGAARAQHTPSLSQTVARKLAQAVVATALLGSLMGYGAATGNADTVEWPTGVSVR